MASSKRALPIENDQVYFSTRLWCSSQLRLGVFSPHVSVRSPASHGFTLPEGCNRFECCRHEFLSSPLQFLNTRIYSRVLRCLSKTTCILTLPHTSYICTPPHIDTHEELLTCAACSHFNTVTFIYI